MAKAVILTLVDVASGRVEKSHQIGPDEDANTAQRRFLIVSKAPDSLADMVSVLHEQFGGYGGESDSHVDADAIDELCDGLATVYLDALEHTTNVGDLRRLFGNE